jgi:EmrB/QacA subfamily drug resistance transporter
MARLRGNPWAILVVLCAGFFMILLDTTIVNIAIPSIIDALKASLDEILWVLNAYILVYAVLLIIAGRLGDLYGQRNVFAIGLAIFTISSALCGFSQSTGQLIAFRVLQGLGGALLTPQTLAILTTLFPPERRGAAFGVWGGVAGLASIAGPTLGGFLVTDVNWRWIFYVNVPIGIAAFVAIFLLMPDIRPGRRHSLDLVGVLLSTAGLFCITFGLIEGQKFDWGTVTGFLTIPEIIAAGGVLVLAFFVWERFQTEPLVPLSLFSNRNFSITNLVSALIAFGMLGLFLPFVIYLQSVLGMSALNAGLAIAPMSLISMPIAPFAGRMADRIGGKYILMTGLALFAIGMAVLDWSAGLNSDWKSFLPGVLIAGAGLGCTFAPLTTVAMRNIQPRMAGAASSVLNTTRQLGAVVGSATIGAILQNRLATALHDEALRRSVQLPAQFRQRFVDGFNGAAKAGLNVGRGQTGSAAQTPAGVPPDVARQLAQVAHDTFVNAYLNAMRPTLIFPVVLLAIGSLSCTLIVRRKRGAPAQESAEAIPAS